MNPKHIFIIGAQKSATTSLHHILSNHKEIDSGIDKEPNFFSKEKLYTKGYGFYLKNYTNDNKNIKLDSSQSYLSIEKTPERIYTMIGRDIKIIIALRDPVDRIESAFNHFKTKYAGEVSRGVNDILPIKYCEMSLDELIEYEQKNIQSLIKENKIISRDEEWIKNGFPFNYFNNSYYTKHVFNYLKYFDPNNILIVSFKDITENQFSVSQKIFNFLGVEDNDSLSKKRVHKNQTVHFRYKFIPSLIHNTSYFYEKLDSLISNWFGWKFIKRVTKLILYKKDRERLEGKKYNFLKNLYKDEVKKTKEMLSYKSE